MGGEPDRVVQAQGSSLGEVGAQQATIRKSFFRPLVSGLNPGDVRNTRGMPALSLCRFPCEYCLPYLGNRQARLLLTSAALVQSGQRAE